jgi:DNA (cytosine-5)-methyltransferase 1
MARLQSFDDSFVFQGKRLFEEMPKWKFDNSQIEMVTDATPPLLCKQIALTILKHIT